MNEVPAFLKTRLIAQYGAETAERMIEGYAAERPVTLRVNRLKSDSVRIRAELEESGFSVRTVDWYEDALILDGATEAQVRQTRLYEAGEIYLQSLSSMMPPLLLQPQAGDNVLDMTAAPGGKTTQISALSEGKALITACERDGVRADRLEYNLRKQGAPSVTVIRGDAAALSDYFRFDKILLDAPCSGSGTVDLRAPVRITEKLLSACLRMQERLLTKALHLLKEGCDMVYSTCSVLKEENEEMVSRVAAREGAQLISISQDMFSGVPRLPSKAGTLCVLPNQLYEGFFMAKLRRGKRA